jgi:hypothetical protein
MSDFNNNNILIQNNNVIEIVDLIINRKYQYNKFTIYDMFVRQILFDTKQRYTIYNIFNVMKWIVYNGYFKNNFVIDLGAQIKKYGYIKSRDNFYKFNNIIIKITNVSQLLRHNNNQNQDSHNIHVQDKNHQNNEDDKFKNNGDQDKDYINQNKENDKYKMDSQDKNHQNSEDDEFRKDNDNQDDKNNYNINNNYKEEDEYNSEDIKENIDKSKISFTYNKENDDNDDNRNEKCYSYQQSLKLFRNIFPFNRDNSIENKKDYKSLNKINKNDDINKEDLNIINNNNDNNKDSDDRINNVKDTNININKIARDNQDDYEEIIF